MNMYDVLKEYKELLDEGVITLEEFESKKRDLLSLPDFEKERSAEIERKKVLEEKRKAEELRKVEIERNAEIEHQRRLEAERIAEREHQRKLEEDKRIEAEHKRKLEEAKLKEQEEQRKLEEAKLKEQEKWRKLEEEKRKEELRKAEAKEKIKVEKREKNKARTKKTVQVIWTIFVVFLCMVLALFAISGFATRSYLSGIIFAVAAVILLNFRLLGRNNKKALISFGLAIVFFFLGVMVPTTGQRDDGSNDNIDYNVVYEWPEDGLATSVPKPSIETGEVKNNHDTMFDFYLYQATPDDYSAYVDACKDGGYTEVEKDSDGYYRAYNEAGDRYVDIEYHEDDSEIYIVVRAPEEWKDIYWPKSELAKTLPVPDKLYGEIIWDETDNLDIDIANVSETAFNEYIDKCIEFGYDIDYSRYEDSFSAKNKDGIELHVRYEYFDVMNIDAETD